MSYKYIIFYIHSNDIVVLRCNQAHFPTRKANRGISIKTQWNKAVIFNEKTIIAKKNCNTNMQELSEYFKAYESRDNTIGKGTLEYMQDLCCRATISMSIDSIHH